MATPCTWHGRGMAEVALRVQFRLLLCEHSLAGCCSACTVWPAVDSASVACMHRPSVAEVCARPVAMCARVCACVRVPKERSGGTEQNGLAGCCSERLTAFCEPFCVHGMAWHGVSWPAPHHVAGSSRCCIPRQQRREGCVWGHDTCPHWCG